MELSIEKKLRKEFSYQLNLTELDKIEQTVLLATEDKNIVSLNSLRNIFYI